MARKPAKGKQTTLPKGYESIAGFGQGWPNDSTKKGDMVAGTVIEFDEFETGKGKNQRTVQTAKLETADGTVYTLYESSGLRPIFEYETGAQFAIIYDGVGKAKPGQNAPRLYRIGVK